MTTKAERDHLARVAALGCLVPIPLGGLCRMPAEIHHVRRGGGSRDHMRVIPLCARHHRTGNYGVAVHSGRVGWERHYGVTEADLLARVAELLEAQDAN